MTPAERLERLTRYAGGRLALVLSDALIDPMVGDPFAFEYRRRVLRELEDAIAEEREACAKIADAEADWSQGHSDGDIRDGQLGAASRIAAAIRARP